MIPALAMTVLRSVPPHLVAQVASGNAAIFGSVIKDVGTGRIIGLLQETAGLAQINPVLAVANMGIKVAGLVADGVIIDKVNKVQKGVTKIIETTDTILAGVEHLQEGMDAVQSGIGMLKALGIADLAVGVAGIGVSAVGFTVVSAKIDGVKRAVEGVAAQVDLVSDKIDRLQATTILTDLSNVRGLANSYEEAWLLSPAAAEKRWMTVSHEVHQVQSRIEAIAQMEFAGHKERYAQIEPLMDALALSGMISVTSLMACNEVEAAKAAAADNARRIELITGSIGLSDMSRTLFKKPDAPAGSAGWLIAEAEANQAARQVIRRIRHREAAAVTRAAPLDSLTGMGVSPREWLEAARTETEAPLLYLPAA